MIYQIGDRFVLHSGKEGVVRFISWKGRAYLVPGEEEDGLKGVVFEILDRKGFDTSGKKAHAINKGKCGAV
jgi:hypothetical protein